jgi:cysteine desulfurase / selenocysteine lyase
VRARGLTHDDLDVAAIRAEFPALARQVNGHGLVYLDSASTTQKPRRVIDAVRQAYEATANVHRGVHTLSVEVTEAFESARRALAEKVGAVDPDEIVFVRGTTEAINLVAQAWGRRNVGPGDEVLVTQLEHHSNLVPWQMLCEERGARIRALPIDDRGEVILESLDASLSARTRVVAMSHVSNSLGTVVPVAEIAKRAKAAGALVVVDGAQAAAHVDIDVQALGCDFYCLSGHKMYGPTGVGALWGRREILEAMAPWQGGGDMVLSVRLDGATYNRIPYKFEAGTPDIVGAIGLGAAVEWTKGIGLDRIRAHERAVLELATRTIGAIAGVRLVGTARDKVAVLSFTVADIHPHDIGSALDAEGIAVRAGHHCAQPALSALGLEATVRASFGVYSDAGDVDALARALERAILLLRG